MDVAARGDRCRPRPTSFSFVVLLILTVLVFGLLGAIAHQWSVRRDPRHVAEVPPPAAEGS